MRRLILFPSRGRRSARLLPLATAAALACGDDAPSPMALDPGAGLEAGVEQTITFRQITAGGDHTCGLTESGAAYCWGFRGALGLGADSYPDRCDSWSCTYPVPVTGGLAFRQISAGWGHTCGVTSDDRLFCWGLNHTGQLGDGTTTDRRHPVRIGRELRVLQVSAGQLHTCAVTTGYAAYCWGHNQAGPLGTGTLEWSYVPTPVARGLAFREVSAGNQFTCGVTTGNTAYCWGLNADGQLGVGTDQGPEYCFTGDGEQSCAPRPVRVARGLAIARVSSGGAHACAVATDDAAFCWGDDVLGQLGDGGPDGSGPCTEFEVCGSARPIRVRGRLAFIEVRAGQQHTCGVTVHHQAYCWGGNYSGELGIGTASGPEHCPLFDIPCSTRPLRVFGERRYARSSAGHSHSCGSTLAGAVFCWGTNRSGQLGDGTTRDHPRPRPVLAAGPI